MSSGRSRRGLLALACVLCAAAPVAARPLLSVLRAQDQRESTVGVPARIAEIVLPGTELEVVPLDAKSPLVMRIAATYPHGTARRYDLEYWGLEPGEYDLALLLRRKDGTSTSDLPPVPVTVRSLLGPGMVLPHAPAPGGVPWFGGYTLVLVLGGVLWVAGLLALLLVGRRRRKSQADAARVRPQTLAERLRPLVERALQGELSPRERAQLELSLVAHWRRRLGLDEQQPEVALALLRDHAEAGPLLRALEDWLHRPDPPADVDVTELLIPYRNLPPDELDVAPAPQAAEPSPAARWA